MARADVSLCPNSWAWAGHGARPLQGTEWRAVVGHFQKALTQCAHGRSKALSERPPRPWTFIHGRMRDAQGSETWSLSSDKLRASALLWPAAWGRGLGPGERRVPCRLPHVVVPWPPEPPGVLPTTPESAAGHTCSANGTSGSCWNSSGQNSKSKAAPSVGTQGTHPGLTERGEHLPQNTRGRRVPGASCPRTRAGNTGATVTVRAWPPPGVSGSEAALLLSQQGRPHPSGPRPLSLQSGQPSNYGKANGSHSPEPLMSRAFSR